MGNNDFFWDLIEKSAQMMSKIKNSTPEELAEKAAEEAIDKLQESSELKATCFLYQLATEHNYLIKLLIEKKILDQTEAEKIESASALKSEEWKKEHLATRKAEFKKSYLNYFTDLKAETCKGREKV